MRRMHGGGMSGYQQTCPACFVGKWFGPRLLPEDTRRDLFETTLLKYY